MITHQAMIAHLTVIIQTHRHTDGIAISRQKERHFSYAGTFGSYYCGQQSII